MKDKLKLPPIHKKRKVQCQAEECSGKRQQNEIDKSSNTHFVTATTYRLFILTWKKLVDPSVIIGLLTSEFETTCIRKTSAIDRLGRTG